jgi:hypothetical protein
MIRILTIGMLLVLTTLSCSHQPAPSVLRTGDIIYQTTESSQCKAVQLATHSIYSHCGIIFMKNNEPFVYEAIGPVKYTPFNDWIHHGKNAKYVVKRYKDLKVITPEVQNAMVKAGEKYKGLEYDLYFGWSDELIYCSELVYKIYKDGANIEACKLKKLKDFDLSHPAVKAKLKERYGNNIPLDEIVVAPSDLFESDLFVELPEGVH